LIPDWTRFLLPRTHNPDRWALYHVILLDLAVLIASCMIQSVIAPAWSLPSSAIPIYAVLVILLGLYRRRLPESGNESRAELSALAKAATFAMALVLVAGWNDLQASAALAALESAWAALWRDASDEAAKPAL